MLFTFVLDLPLFNTTEKTNHFLALWSIINGKLSEGVVLLWLNHRKEHLRL